MTERFSRPLLVMFAGPNGSGKSSVTPSFQSQPGFPQNYINPDVIALTLGGNTMEKAYEASAIAAKKRLKCIKEKQSFSFETVMSHPSKLAILETAKAEGFEARVVFVSTESSNLNIDRVRKRVIDGGHDVPKDKIVSRYHRSLSLLPKASEIADKTYVVDNSSSLQIKAVLSQGQIIEKSGEEIEWVEDFLNTLDERRQEIITIEQVNSNTLLARLDKGEYVGEVESVGKHFCIQKMKSGQTVIHENAILNLDNSAIGENITVTYQNGVHQVKSTEEIQQQRVEKIAPILIDYLEHNQKEEVETDNSVVKYDLDTKTVFYQDKLNSQEYLKAQRLEEKWLDRGSNISQSKEFHITSMAAEIAKKQAQISKSAEPKKKKRSL